MPGTNLLAAQVQGFNYYDPGSVIEAEGKE
jgi:hypothetical protein